MGGEGTMCQVDEICRYWVPQPPQRQHPPEHASPLQWMHGREGSQCLKLTAVVHMEHPHCAMNLVQTCKLMMLC